MKPLLRDVFREAIDRAKQMGIWDKLNVEQREALVSKYLLQQYNSVISPSQAGTASTEVPGRSAFLSSKTQFMQESHQFV